MLVYVWEMTSWLRLLCLARQWIHIYVSPQWLSGEMLLENVDVFCSLFGPSVDTCLCVSFRDFWYGGVSTAPCTWQSFVRRCLCLRSTTLGLFWEMTSGWMLYSVRYLVRQWIQVYVSSRRLLVYFTCRARRRHLQWYVLAGFAGYDTPRAVFFDVDVRGDFTGAVLGQVIVLVVEARGDSTGAVLGQGDVLVWCFWSDSAENCGFSAAVFLRWSSTSRSWCKGRFLWFYCSVDQEIPQLQYVERWSMPLLRMSCLTCPSLCNDRCSWSDDFMFISVFSAELGSTADTCAASVYGAF